MAVIEVDRARDGVAVLTLNRPEARNAMSAELIAGLHETFGALRHDTSCRVIVLTGAGAGFCAGLDLKEGATPAGAAGSSGTRWPVCGPSSRSPSSCPACGRCPSRSSAR